MSGLAALAGPYGSAQIVMRVPPGNCPIAACAWALLLSMALPVARAAAAELDGPDAAPAGAESIRSGERLSEFLARQRLNDPSNDPSNAPAIYPKQAPAQDPFLSGLQWRVPEARARQQQIRHRLLAALATPGNGAAGADRRALAALVRSMQASGRVPIELPDPQWLAVHPASDPVLDRSQQVLLPPGRPQAVAVVTDSAGVCLVAHHGGWQARAYLQACMGDAAGRIDRAWIAQPDGRVQAYGIAAWNEQAQDEPGPGSWIWAPARDANWPQGLSADMAALLAAQGPVLAAPTSGAGADPAAIAPPLVFAGVRTAGGEVPAFGRGREGAISANDWGIIGLLQTPTARMAQAGEIRATFSHVYPYGRLNLMLQPLDWMEVGFRYTSINNKPYGPASFSGTQSYKDKSADVKLRVLRESAAAPELALGVTDVGGTGLFGGEYLVGSKRWGDWDWSAGLAWGYQGGRADLPNPLSIFAKSFAKRRGAGNSSTGTFDLQSYFHGRTAPFAGLQYQLPDERWLLKAELDPNNYQHDPTAIPRGQRSPVNLGVVYRPSPNLDLTAGVERGNAIELSINFHGPLNRLDAPKIFDPRIPAVAESAPADAPDWSKTAEDVQRQTQWRVVQIRRTGHDLQLVVEGPFGAYIAQRIDRAVAVLHRDAPADIERFVFSLVQYGLPLTDWVVLRKSWVQGRTRYQPAAPSLVTETQTEPGPEPVGTTLLGPRLERLGAGIEPQYTQVLGGPDGFVLFELGVAAPVSLRIDESTWVSAEADLRVVDNYGNYRYDGPSLLPRVRTYVREYLTTSRATLPILQLTHVGALGREQFYSVYAGLLESMFAGAGSEWLYRPWNGALAFGVDVNRVQQRAFEQNFSMRDYRVTTGHATLYWDTGWSDTHVNLSVGQYLAADRGATLDVSRHFSNGVQMGAYATKTNVSTAQFGEGSFDKGIYVRAPLDAFLLASSTGSARFLWTPLTRDGGAKLDRQVVLYDLTAPRDHRAGWTRSAGYQRDGTWSDGDDAASSGPGLWQDFAADAGSLGNAAIGGRGVQAQLLGVALVGASALLDKPVASWATRHQGGRWDKVGKAAGEIPLGLGLGTGIVWSGVGDELDRRTAQTALFATGFTLGAEELLRLGVNRARPDQNLGPAHFGGAGQSAAQSGFPSLHAGAAFALLTPFAQRYEAPWLYALGAAAAFGRVQQRRHFVSDVVAGSLTGYGIATVLYDRQRNGPGSPKVEFAGVGSIRATWQF